MLTRQGWLAVTGAILALVVARVFAVRELYILSTALAFVAVFAVVSVRIFRPRVTVERMTNSDVLVVGDPARMSLRVAPAGQWSPAHELIEPVGHTTQARLGIGRLDGPASVAYSIPTDRRGLVSIGPLVASRRDLLGLARSTNVLAPAVDVAVAPRALPIEVPKMGRGPLGRQLAVLALRLGLDDFQGLRDYVTGDELRSIHWKASARGDNLKVKEYENAGLSRCVVVLDLATGPETDDGVEPFEAAATAAASVMVAADGAGLATRFVSGGGVDLRGPSATVQTLDYLARVQPQTDARSAPIDRDPGEGLGLVVIISPTRVGPIWRAAASLSDPGVAVVGLITAEEPARRAGDRFEIAAHDEAGFLQHWAALVGTRAPTAATAPLDAAPAAAAPPEPTIQVPV